MTASYRAAMAQIHAATPLPAFRSGFHSAPRNLRALLQACTPLGIDQARFVTSTEFDNQDWTEECQGVVFEAGHWYLSSNKTSKQAVYQFDANMIPTGLSLNMSGYGDHLGALGSLDGKIFAPFEPTLNVVWFGTDLLIQGQGSLQGKDGGAPPQADFPWCSVNPWNGLLYTSPFDAVSQLFAYDPNANFRHVATLDLGTTVDRVQGGCFSPQGHIFLACDSETSPAIHAFTALNGSYLGAIPLIVDGVTGEEVEGICFAGMTISNTFAPLHVIVLDNDIGGDDISFRHYSLPSSAA